MEKSSISENKRVSAIKTLLDSEGLTQEELAGMIYVKSKKTKELVPMEPQNLSRCLTSGNVSEKMCRRIAELFPGYRIEYILGYDDYPTTADLLASVLDTAKQENDIMTSALFSLAKLSGFSIEPTERSDNSVESYLKAIKKAVTFSRDGKSVSFSLEDLNDFENEICDYIEMRLKRMMK